MKPNFIFTAEALVQAVELHGEKVFTIDAENIFVVEEALVNHHFVKNNPICSKYMPGDTLEIIHKHWLDLKFLPPWGIARPDREECTIIAKADALYPDNIIVCIGKIQELSRLCRVYSNDELINIKELANYFKE